jgi:ComF family protein
VPVEYVGGWLFHRLPLVPAPSPRHKSMMASLPQSLTAHARTVGGAVLDWVLPPRCAGCGIIVGGGAGFCPDCWQSLVFIGDPGCAQCDRPFAQNQGEGALCGACIADPPRWDRGRAALLYGPLPRRLVLRLKYGRRVTLARLAARLMAPKLPVQEPGEPPWLLVPVPLHRWRLWSRGFNQSAEIARHLAKASGHALLPDALVRMRSTPTLRGLGRKERGTAVRGAFAVHPGHATQLKGARVMLVDDVWTSGATADACARALRKGGAAEIQLIVLARVLAEADDDWAMIDTAPGASDML